MPFPTAGMIVAGTTLVLLLPAPLLADYASDLAKAKAEAKLAFQATDPEIIALHVHRASNCLYGRDSYFYERSADPSCDTRVGAVGAATNDIQRRHLYEAGTMMMAVVASTTDVQKQHDQIDDAIKLMDSADKAE